jgi:tRNA(adenine34) deaminase
MMEAALELAREAASAGDVPVGAVVVDAAGNILASDRNRVEELGDPTAHAEMLALRQAVAATGDKWLSGATLYVTLEPCAMCAMAAVWARVDRIVYGAADPKAGAAWSLYNIPQDPRLNHLIQLEEGIGAEAAGELLSRFFAERRI